jgi:lipopolysaccharide heptosyltransferase II
MPTFNKEKISKLTKIDRLFKSIYLFPRNKREHPPIIKTEVRELLVIGFLLIGDTIMYLPALGVLKRNFPNARITIICEKATEIILKDQGLIDSFIIIKCPWIAPFDTSLKNIFNFFAAIKKANSIKYDLAIDFRGDWRNIFYMNFINARRKASYNFTGGEYMLTDVFKPDESIVHFTEESFYFLKQLGCDYTDNDKFPVLKLTEKDVEYLNNFKAGNCLENKFIVGVHPGTSQEVKRWDEEKYSELIVRLAKDYSNLSFIIFEGPNERDTVSKIETVLITNNIEYLVVSKSLKEYILLLSLCQLIICNDSGAAHIAAAYGIPIVVIFGNVDPKYVIPYGSEMRKIISHNMECKPCYQSYCRFGHKLCIVSVSVDEVYNSAADIIDRSKSILHLN